MLVWQHQLEKSRNTLSLQKYSSQTQIYNIVTLLSVPSSSIQAILLIAVAHQLIAMSEKTTITEKAILIRISKSYHDQMSPIALYEATRGVWKLGDRRDEAEYAFSIADGKILEVYKIQSWHPAGSTSYYTRGHNTDSYGELDIDGRVEFSGVLAEGDIRQKYINHDISHYFKQGMANPTIYVNI